MTSVQFAYFLRCHYDLHIRALPEEVKFSEWSNNTSFMSTVKCRLCSVTQEVSGTIEKGTVISKSLLAFFLCG